LLTCSPKTVAGDMLVALKVNRSDDMKKRFTEEQIFMLLKAY
jgi:hypothetical protein